MNLVRSVLCGFESYIQSCEATPSSAIAPGGGSAEGPSFRVPSTPLWRCAPPGTRFECLEYSMLMRKLPRPVPCRSYCSARAQFLLPPLRRSSTWATLRPFAPTMWPGLEKSDPGLRSRSNISTSASASGFSCRTCASIFAPSAPMRLLRKLSFLSLGRICGLARSAAQKAARP